MQSLLAISLVLNLQVQTPKSVSPYIPTGHLEPPRGFVTKAVPEHSSIIGIGVIGLYILKKKIR
ncbi:hypothetical protein NUACC21_69220 [Scytonema sp. NUACC21]